MSAICLPLCAHRFCGENRYVVVIYRQKEVLGSTTGSDSAAVDNDAVDDIEQEHVSQFYCILSIRKSLSAV